MNNVAAASLVVERPVQFNNAAQIPQEISLESKPLQPLEEAKTPTVQAPTAMSVAKPPTGSHTDWMAAAGIGTSDYGYVEFIISHESSWNPQAVNPSSGSCGLVQALPCSKLGADWSNPVVALKWGDNYVKSRYGGWKQAVEWWQIHKWY